MTYEKALAMTAKTLILSGWTQPVDALQLLDADAHSFDYSDYEHPEASFEGLSRYAQTEHVIGWSMGGQLALRAIAAGVLRPKHLTLLGTPYQFLSAGHIKGMDPLTFNQFRENYIANPGRTKTRFHGLVAKGDRDFARVMGMLGHHPQVEHTVRWLPWLDALAAAQLTYLPLDHAPPTLIIHGMNDAIVPYTQAQLLADKLPHAAIELWPEVGHAPHAHDAARLRASIHAHRKQHGVG